VPKPFQISKYFSHRLVQQFLYFADAKFYSRYFWGPPCTSALNRDSVDSENWTDNLRYLGNGYFTFLW